MATLLARTVPTAHSYFWMHQEHSCDVWKFFSWRFVNSSETGCPIIRSDASSCIIVLPSSHVPRRLSNLTTSDRAKKTVKLWRHFYTSRISRWDVWPTKHHGIPCPSHQRRSLLSQIEFRMTLKTLPQGDCLSDPWVKKQANIDTDESLESFPMTILGYPVAGIQLD